MDEKKEVLSRWLLEEKHKKLVVILGLLGIALIFFSSYIKPKTSVQTATEEKKATVEYLKQLEENLKAVVSSIEGVGETKVLVTLENGPEIKYATEEKINSQEIMEEKSNSETQTKQTGDSEKKYIIIKDSDGTERALAVTEFEPTVKGVVVVCSGGDVPVVQQRVIHAVTTALNISTKKVCVTKLTS